MIKIKFNNQNAFTLIETLVAISLLMVAIVGPMGLAAKGVSSVIESKNQIIAFYLAQEGIEYIRLQRDNNTFLGLGWLTGLESCLVDLNVNGCRVDVTAPANNINACNDATCIPLRYDSLNDVYYTYSGGGSETIFTRVIKITQISNNIEAKIEAEVSWKNIFGVTKRVVLEENIFNWK